ncbi:hypothetical protein [Nocardia sp. NPDC051981]|uniref:hypothetical protein n=1 Tax=Nocardia sp. NPDC051981 TaxID=3155417 RepID=UPI00341649B4
MSGTYGTDDRCQRRRRAACPASPARRTARVAPIDRRSPAWRTAPHDAADPVLLDQAIDNIATKLLDEADCPDVLPVR